MKLYITLMIIFFFALQTSTSNHPDIIKDTCKKIASKDPNVNLTLCINSFNMMPKAHNSTLQGLGLIATQISKQNASNITKKIKKLLKEKSVKKSPYLMSCLKSCLEVYLDAIDDLQISTKAIKGGRYNDANVYLSSVIDAPSTCEDGFSDEGIKSLLKEEDEEFSGHSVIALSVVAMLQEERGTKYKVSGR